jgi:RNA polymerase sigma-70 factor (ECF subfamily)
MRALHLEEEDAKDLAQDVFVRFYEAMEEYRGDAEWAYLETIARRLAYNRTRDAKTFKRNAKLVPIDGPDFKNEPAAPAEPDYAEVQDAALKQTRLRSAIEELPQGQQECLALWLSDFKYEQIAAALRITVDAVKSRIRDAKRLLRDRLGEEATLPEEKS